MKNRKLGNKYEIIERLGRGGMAEVYRAHHVSLDRYVAIKVLHDFLADDPEFKSRFEKEARNIARLKHPHIVQVYDFEYDEASQSYYMVMELIDGDTLKERLAESESASRPLEFPEALRITREAASALAYAHRAGMIHRDVKPANLILDANENHRVVLTDFGIARMITSAQLTISGGLLGTPAYMSPEQGVGETGDERSDLYSLGVILFQMLTGKTPYNAETPLALILKHLNDPVPSACAHNTHLPERIDHILAMLMAKEPEDRYQSAVDVISDIEKLEIELQTEQTIVLPRVNPKPRQKLVPDDIDPIDEPTQTLGNTPHTKGDEPPRRRRLWTIGAALLTIVLVSGIALNLNSVLPVLGFLNNTETPEVTPTPSPDEVFTLTPELESTVAVALLDPTETATSTATVTSSATPPLPTTAAPTRTATLSPTIPATPTATQVVTATMTPDVTGTYVAERTATFEACLFDYAVIEQSPPDGERGGFFPINSRYSRVITLLNTGTCAWERNTSLAFISGSGESFAVGPRVFIREPVEVGAEVQIVFEGTLPSRGSVTPLSGSWQLRTPGQIPIGEPITLSILVYDPGPG